MKSLSLALLFQAALLPGFLLAAEKPNIIVFYTDDHGYADLGIQDAVEDIRTPHTDALAKSGAVMRHGYSTAPQCVPSRAGLLAGRFQARFGVEANGTSLKGFDEQITIAERMQKAGYVTAQFGKWHLGPGPQIVDHGFTHVFNQNSQRPFAANITPEGEDRPMGNLPPDHYHIDGCSLAAASLIERYKDDPFFLYIAYRAPHVPLDATKKYLDRFPGEMPERRRQALAMISAMDDGVGLITETLQKQGLTEKTLIFYIGDNGAPLKIRKADIPGGGPGWDGSLNTPLNGEKGMLAEGGIHVPFAVTWPGAIPAGQEYEHPVSALDVAATAASLAGIETNPGDLDGVDLIPFLTGEKSGAPHEALHWRWVAQSAIREGDWKLLRGGDREYLYNLSTDLEEKNNLAAEHPDIVKKLRNRLREWTSELAPPGLTTGQMSEVWENYYDFYMEGKPAPPLREKFAAAENAGADTKGWVVRGGELAVADGNLEVKGIVKKSSPFLALAKVKFEGPALLSISWKTEGRGDSSVSWRLEGDKDFMPANKTTFHVSGGDDWFTSKVAIPAEGKVIHLRINPPNSEVSIRDIRVEDSTGKKHVLWGAGQKS